MNLIELCPICSTNNCQCKQSLVSFFNLLTSTSDRVSRAVPASVSGPSFKKGGIDKLEGYFKTPIPKDLILARARNLDLPTNRVYLKDRRPYLKVGSEDQHIYLKLSPNTQEVTALVSNPNRFQMWESYWAFIQNLTPCEALFALNISRLDLNLDFSCPLHEILKSLDLKGKRTSISFNDTSGIREGATIGKGKETIVIYDKAKESGLIEPLTRVELRLLGEKLPARQLIELPNTLLKTDFFQNVIGISIHEPQPNNQRLTEFKSIWMRDGYYLAKKALNQNRNFDRDITKLLKIDRWTLQPSDLIKQEIHKFFNHRRKEWIH